MRFGIIAEGKEDQIAIEQILLGVIKGLDSSDVVYIRPSLAFDETDRNNATIGTLQGVKNACIERVDFDNFFLFEDSDYLIIHLDTAEIENQGEVDFQIQRPRKEKHNLDFYCLELRNRCIAQIDTWLDGNYKNQLLYAISIEEMEAWVLALLEDKQSANSANPKKKLLQELSKRKQDKTNLIKDFSRPKLLEKATRCNKSLALFVESLSLLSI